MPKKKHSHNSYDRSILTTLEDLTVNDVANNEVKRQCLKKISLGGAVNKGCHLGSETFSEEDEDDRDMDCTASFPPNTGYKRKRRRKLDLVTNSSGTLELPIDIWELISDHLMPEDVGRFAAVCRTACFVVSTARFWNSMYNRFCRGSSSLPAELSHMQLRQCGVVGLRNRVVRSLYYCYPPLSQTVVQHTPSFTNAASQRTNKLLHGRCLIFWHLRKGTKHHYVFKVFQRESLPNQALYGRRFCDPSTQSSDQAVQVSTQRPACEHQDDGCFLLEVVCSSLCQVDHAVVGLYVNMICETPAEISNYRLNKLSLSLTQSPYASSRSSSHKNNVYRHIGWNDMTKVVLQPVESVRVLPWWEQGYYTVSCPDPLSTGQDDECQDEQDSDMW